MKRSSIAVLLLLLAATVIACGGGGNKSAAAKATPTRARAVATATPTGGPTATLSPASGRPGVEVTITGSGWPAATQITISQLVPAGQTVTPYVTLTTDANGSFSTRLRLDKTPAGDTLKVGRFDLVARSSTQIVRLPFEVTPPTVGNVGGG